MEKSWMVIENGQFVPQTEEQIAENPNRDFYREIGDEKYEVLSVKDATTPYTMPISSVSHWAEFDPKEAMESLSKEDIAWIEEQMNGKTLESLSPAEFANTMLYNGGESQPHDMSAIGGEFYPHEIPVYMEQLDSDVPLSPADYQASLSLKQQTENYKIANDAYEKQEATRPDNQKIEDSHKENEYSLD